MTLRVDRRRPAQLQSYRFGPRGRASHPLCGQEVVWQGWARSDAGNMERWMKSICSGTIKRSRN